MSFDFFKEKFFVMEEYKRVLRDDPLVLVCDCGNHVTLRRRVFWVFCENCGSKLEIKNHEENNDGVDE